MIVHRPDAPDAMAGVLLDGFPRNVAQANALEARLAERGGAIRVAVYVDVPTDVLIERLAGRWMCRPCRRRNGKFLIVIFVLILISMLWIRIRTKVRIRNSSWRALATARSRT